jgi:diguanylate cyclase
MNSSKPLPVQPGDIAERFEVDLADVRAKVDHAIVERVWAIVQEQASSLSAKFYVAMFEDPLAARMLDHDVVNRRLLASMQRWLLEVFDPASDAAGLAQTQRRTGEVHARVGVPITMVSRGGRVLARHIVASLDAGDLDRSALLSAALYVHEMLGLTIDTMASAFAQNTNRLARSDEAYRLYHHGQDLRADRERRRSELLEWSQQILERYFWDAGDPTVMRAADTAQAPFALWLNHKAAMLFEGSAEVAAIQSEVRRVEGDLVPRLARARDHHAEARVVVAAIQRAVDHIKVLLVSMFDQQIAAKDARDAITGLLNRRYFPSVVRREITLSQTQSIPFALLMLDVDSFAGLAGAATGPDAGAAVLSRVAALVQDHLRAGDFVFRIGDDEFLVLLTECTGHDAMQVAEGLRQAIAGLRIESTHGEAMSVSVSIGVAAYDGHPDYQHLLDRADAALRRAKQEGRNRCVMAERSGSAPL